VLNPVEVVLLACHRERLRGRVLEIGCGAGRMLGYLVTLGGEVTGIDVSGAMLDHCRRRYPSATLVQGDMRDVGSLVSGPFDAILIPDATLDVLEPEDRQGLLRAVAGLLAPDGALIFSSHNRESLVGGELGASETPSARERLEQLARVSPAQLVGAARRRVRAWANRQRLAGAQRTTEAHAVLNDPEGDWGALHIYITPAAQARELAAAGLTLRACLDPDGERVEPRIPSRAPWLHYVAGRADREPDRA
jgi:SAM-dependent methyltransferase